MITLLNLISAVSATTRQIALEFACKVDTFLTTHSVWLKGIIELR